VEKSKKRQLNVFGTFLESVQERNGVPPAHSKTMDLLRILANNDDCLTLEELQQHSGMPIIRLVKELDELKSSNFVEVDDEGDEVRLTSMGANVLKIAG